MELDRPQESKAVSTDFGNGDEDLALSGLVVVDFGQYLAGPLVAMMLADLGAEVIRVDPPGGPRWQHGANAMLQRGKKSITLDLHSDGDRRVAEQLIERADLVIEGFRPGVMDRLGLGPKTSTGRNNRLIYVSLPGFGHDDPRASMAGWEGVINAAAGVFETVPGFAAPTYNALPIASTYGALVAAHSIMAALIARERDGLGQWVEVPLFDATFEAIGQKGQLAPVTDTVPYMQTRKMAPSLGHYRCADGLWLHLCLIQDRHLQWFADEFLPQDWIDEGIVDADRLWNDPDLAEHARKRFAELFATRTSAEWERAINEVTGAPSAACHTTEHWLREDSHARDIGAVIDIDDPEFGPMQQGGYPIVLSATPARARSARHGLDSDRDEILAGLGDPIPTHAVPSAPPLTQALAGIRVVDLTQVLAGPTSARILAEYGAEVTKIQNAHDKQLRYHLYGNSGKRTILLDLKADAGHRVLERIVTGADIFVENFASGVAERLGVGEDEIRKMSPEIVYGSLNAYGRQGFRGAWRGREELGQAVTGMQVRWGGYCADDEPMAGPLTFTDSGTGLVGAFGMLVGLFHRLRTGRGQRVETSLAHAGTYEQIPFMYAHAGRTWDEPNGLLAVGMNALDRIYPTSDGWLYLATDLQNGREQLNSTAGFGTVDFDAEQNALAAAMTAILATENAAVWVQRLRDSGIACHEVLDIPRVMEDQVSKSRGLSAVREHMGLGPVRNPGPTPRLSRTPAVLARPAAMPGLESRSVLDDFGFGEDADALIAAKIVREELPLGVELFGRPR